MSLVNKTQVEPNVWSLEISIDAEVFAKAQQQVYQKNKKRYNVPGFRRGKASFAMIARLYGKEVFYEDALEACYPDAIEAAYAEGDIKAVAPPYDMEVPEMGEDGVKFTVNVAVKPEVQLGGYKGLAAEKAEITVSEADITEEIDRMRERNSRIITAERAAQDGDITEIDFEGFLNGKAFEGGKGEKYELTLGSGQFIPGFEEKIVGRSAGESFDVNVTFPAEYGAEELAGKEVVFKVLLHSVKIKELPEMDDEFAKDLGEYETVDELKKGIQADILARRQSAEDKNFENKLMDLLAEQVAADIPQAMIRHKGQENIRNYANSLAQQGMDLETYLGYMGMDMAQFEEQGLERAESQIKIDLALEKIVEMEGLAPSEEDIAAEYQRLADQYQMEAEKLREIIAEKMVADDLNKAAAVKLVADNAVAEKPAAKKPAAKKPAAKKAAAEAEAAAEEAPAKKPAAKKAPAKKKAEAAEAADAAVEEAPAKKPAAKKKPVAKKEETAAE